LTGARLYSQLLYPEPLLLDLAVQSQDSQDPGILLIFAAPSTAQTFFGDEDYDLLSSHSGRKLFRISVRIHPIFQMLCETDICQSRPRLAPSRRRRPISLTSDRLNDQQLYDYGIYNLRQQLAPVPGVTFPTPDGGKYRQIMVDIDPLKLQARGLMPHLIGRKGSRPNIDWMTLTAIWAPIR
jgi:hypothetical protein